ncbi:2 iron, 2 sulfur cluster binding [Blomia tropicalis]|nr:2 iron, 2 sulfur cluster binding [Blomia tropicalis]
MIIPIGSLLRSITTSNILIRSILNRKINDRLIICNKRTIFIETYRQQQKESGDQPKKEKIQVNYITKDNEKITLYGNEGDNVMHLAQQNSVDIEGACEASLACCTCHVYVRDSDFDRLEPPTEEEEDLLDMAPFLKSNSRLSCQIVLSKDIDGIEVTLPPATRNFYVDDHKPSHH